MFKAVKELQNKVSQLQETVNKQQELLFQHCYPYGRICVQWGLYSMDICYVPDSKTSVCLCNITKIPTKYGIKRTNNGVAITIIYGKQTETAVNECKNVFLYSDGKVIEVDNDFSAEPFDTEGRL